jgi:hypothetical protein
MRLHVIGVGRSLHLWRVGLVGHVRVLGIGHINWISFIALYLLAIIFKFDIHFPRGIFFLQLFDDFMAKGLIALHGNKCIAEEVEPAPRTITFNDSINSGCVT